MASYKVFKDITNSTVRSFTGMDRNGPNYRNGLPEWTIKCAPEYFSCTIFGQSGLKKP